MESVSLKKSSTSVGWKKKRLKVGYASCPPPLACSGRPVSAVYLCLLLVQSLQTTTISVSPQEEQGRQMRDEEQGGAGGGMMVTDRLGENGREERRKGEKSLWWKGGGGFGRAEGRSYEC